MSNAIRINDGNACDPVVAGFSTNDKVSSVNFLNSEQRRRLKSDAPEQGNSFDEDFCVGQASGSSHSLHAGFSRIECNKVKGTVAQHGNKKDCRPPSPKVRGACASLTGN